MSLDFNLGVRVGEVLNRFQVKGHNLSAVVRRALQVYVWRMASVVSVSIFSNFLHAAAADGAANGGTQSGAQAFVMGLIFGFLFLAFSFLVAEIFDRFVKSVFVGAKVIYGFLKKHFGGIQSNRGRKTDSPQKRNRGRWIKEKLNKLFKIQHADLSHRLVCLVPRVGLIPALGALLIDLTGFSCVKFLSINALPQEAV